MTKPIFGRAADFLGRATFGGESGFIRNPMLMWLFLGLGLVAIIAKSDIAGLAAAALLLGVFVMDVRRYNREHPRI